MIRKWLLMLLPGLMGAGGSTAPTSQPSTGPSTRPSTRPAPRNSVRPEVPPFMIGVNLCGAEFGQKQLPGEYGKDYTYPQAESLDYYKSRGILLVRLPFRWERMQPTMFGPLDEKELARLQNFVNEVRSRGMKVIPEPHNFARYYDKLIGGCEVNNEAFADFWKRLAEPFRNEEAIWAWGLMNEPHDTNGLWPESAQAGVDAIRTVDTKHVILVPGDKWSGAADWRKYNEDLWVTDPMNKIVYEAHLYFDKDKSGRYVKGYDREKGSPTIGIERLAGFEQWLAERNAVGFIGEFGVPGREARWLEALEVFVNHLREKQISGCYWAGGPWWYDYALSIEPRGGIDAAQMRVLGESSGQSAVGGGQ